MTRVSELTGNADCFDTFQIWILVSVRLISDLRGKKSKSSLLVLQAFDLSNVAKNLLLGLIMQTANHIYLNPRLTFESFSQSCAECSRTRLLIVSR